MCLASFFLDYKSSFEEKIVQSDDSCRVDKDEGQFTSGRHATTTVKSGKVIYINLRLNKFIIF